MNSIACSILSSEKQEAVLRELASGQLAQEEQVATLRRRSVEVCHVQEAVAKSSRTAAFHLALLAPSIASIDEVISSAFSFAANANAILLVGATPVIVDIELDIYPLNPSLVESALIPHADSTRNITTGESGIATTIGPEIAQYVFLLAP